MRRADGWVYISRAVYDGRTMRLLLLLSIACSPPKGDSAEDSAPANLAPSAPGVAITPAAPSGAADLVAAVTTEAVDPEGAAVTYAFAWTVDGIDRTDLATETVPLAELSEGQTWSVAATASDGALASEAGVASVTVQHLPPTAPVIHIAPEAPAPGTALILVFDTEAADPNGDTLTQTVEWYENEVLTEAYTGLSTIQAPNVQPADVFRVVVTVTDGTSDPVSVEAETTVSGG